MDANSGNDDNSGSETCPLKTIQAAVDKAQNGDQIFVQNGNYQESVSINGLDDIELRAIGNRVIIDGSLDISEIGATWQLQKHTT